MGREWIFGGVGLVLGVLLGVVVAGLPGDAPVEGEDPRAPMVETVAPAVADRRAAPVPRHPADAQEPSSTDVVESADDEELVARQRTGPSLRRQPTGGPPPPPTPGPMDDWSVAQFLDELRALVAGNSELRCGDLISALRRLHPNSRAPLDLLYALHRSDHRFDPRDVVGGLTAAERGRVLVDAGGTGPNAAVGRRLAPEAARWLLRSGAPVPVDVTERLLRHSDWQSRRVGLRLAWAAPKAFHEGVRRLADHDPEAQVRQLAFEILLDWANDGGTDLDPLLVEVSERLSSGSVEEREALAEVLFGLGPEAGRVALAHLIEERPDPESGYGRSLVDAAVAHGLAGELLARDLGVGWDGAVAAALLNLDDEQLALGPEFDPFVRRLVRAEVGEDRLLIRLVSAGRWDAVAALARDTEVRWLTREHALLALTTADDHLEPLRRAQSVAREILERGRAPRELLIVALDAMQETTDDADAQFRLEVQWLRSEATRPEVRTLLLRQLGDAWDDEAEERHLPAIRSVLEEVIATETNRWVRAVAEEELRELGD